MSLEARQKLVTQLKFTDDSQRSDLLDPTITSTFLVELIQSIANHCPKGLLLTAVRTDHPTYDGGPDGHGHNAGKAVDLWTASSNDDDILEVIQAVAHSPYVWTCGLGGSAKRFSSYVTWPANPFVFFLDNDTDHIHIQSANMFGQGLRV